MKISRLLYPVLLLVAISCNEKPSDTRVTAPLQEKETQITNVRVKSTAIERVMRVSDSANMREILDSPILRTMYESARWLTYCMASLDTIYFSDKAIKELGLPRFRCLAEENLDLEYFGPTKMSFQVGKNKEVKADYQVGMLIKRPEIYEKFTGTLDWSYIKPYRGIEYYYDKYLLMGLCFSVTEPTHPFTVEGDYGYVFVSNPSAAYYCPLVRSIRILNNPFQPEIIKYVRENAGKIHPWFLAEAKKRGMFDSVKYSPKWVEEQIAINKRKPKDCKEPERR